MREEARRTDNGLWARYRRHLPLLLLALLMAVAFQQGWYRYLTFDTLARQRDALGGFVAGNYVLAATVYFLAYVAVVAVSLPGASLMTLAGGLLFGWVGGSVLTVVAATLGATLVFLVARTSLGAGLAARAGPFVGRMAEGFRDNALSYMLFLRLVPVFPFWLVNLAPAVLGVGTATYVFATLVGIVPGTIAFSVVGAGLDSVIDAQKAARDACLAKAGATPADCPFSFDLSAIVTPELLAALALLGFVALIPVAARKYLSRRKAAKGAGDE